MQQPCASVAAARRPVGTNLFASVYQPGINSGLHSGVRHCRSLQRATLGKGATRGLLTGGHGI